MRLNAIVDRPTHVMAAAVLAMLVAPAPASATSITVYTATDSNVTIGSPLPNSTAERALFSTAAASLGLPTLFTFEGVTVGNFTSRAIGSGATVTLSNTLASGLTGLGITNDSADPYLGFNTTAGGSEFLRMATKFIDYNQSTTATATFSFASPINAFAAEFTGLAGGGDTVSLQFTDGTNQLLALSDTAACTPGCAEFFGFTDSGALISSVVLNLTYTNINPGETFTYVLGVDDIQISTPVPEPATLTFTALGLAGIVARHRRRRSQSAS